MIPFKHLKDPDGARSAKQVHFKPGIERTYKLTIQWYITALINVGSINYDHA